MIDFGRLTGSREPDPSFTGSGPTGFDPERELVVHGWSVSVGDFRELPYVARSRGKALSRAWSDYQILGETSFRDFLKIARVQRLNDPDFGEPIMVSGVRGYRVGSQGQYTAFVRPGSEVVLLSHPADVKAIAMEARQRRDAEERPDPKDDSAGRRHRPDTPSLQTPQGGGS